MAAMTILLADEDIARARSSPPCTPPRVRHQDRSGGEGDYPSGQRGESARLPRETAGSNPVYSARDPTRDRSCGSETIHL